MQLTRKAMESKGGARYALIEVSCGKAGGITTSSYRTLEELLIELLSGNGEEFVKKVRDEIIPGIISGYEDDDEDLDEGMSRLTFSLLGEDDENYYDNVYRDFYHHVNDIVFNDEGTFTVVVSSDFLERVFNQSNSGGFSLSQAYKVV